MNFFQQYKNISAAKKNCFFFQLKKTKIIIKKSGYFKRTAYQELFVLRQ